MKDIASNREALDLLRASSQLIRQIREVRDHIAAIEDRYIGILPSRSSNLTQEFVTADIHGDIISMRALNQRLRHELSSYRLHHTWLKAEIKAQDRSAPV
jgi:hypothetical protein